MDSGAAVKSVERAFEAISSNDKYTDAFEADATFLLSQNPYRIDSLKQFVATNASFFDAGGRVTNLQVRQPHVAKIGGDAALVAFHYAQRVEIGGVSVGTHGRGTAIVAGKNGRIVHLHLTENAGAGGVLPSQSVSAVDVLSSIDRLGAGARASLGSLSWGCE